MHYNKLHKLIVITLYPSTAVSNLNTFLTRSLYACGIISNNPGDISYISHSSALNFNAALFSKASISTYPLRLRKDRNRLPLM